MWNQPNQLCAERANQRDEIKNIVESLDETHPTTGEEFDEVFNTSMNQVRSKFAHAHGSSIVSDGFFDGLEFQNLSKHVFDVRSVGFENDLPWVEPYFRWDLGAKSKYRVSWETFTSNYIDRRLTKLLGDHLIEKHLSPIRKKDSLFGKHIDKMLLIYHEFLNESDHHLRLDDRPGVHYVQTSILLHFPLGHYLSGLGYFTVITNKGSLRPEL